MLCPQVLDGITVKNLELLANTSDGTTKGTLIGTLDTCSTAFGKRYRNAVHYTGRAVSPLVELSRLD